MPSPTAQPNPKTATMADVAALRSDFYVHLDVSDDQLLQVLLTRDDLVALARMWDWSDTEVRDQAASVFEEAFNIELS